MTRPQQSSVLPQSAALRSFAAQWRARPADSLSPVREQAMQRFLKLGLPTLQDESWRYTNLRSLAAQSFVDAPCKARGEVPMHASLSLLGQGDDVVSLLMVNGYPQLPLTTKPVNGIEIQSLRDLSNVNSTLL